MRGHIQNRGKSSWRLKFDLAPDPKTGRRRFHFETVRGTKKDAQKRLISLLCEFEDGTYVEPSATMFGDFATHWLESIAAPKVSLKTHERYGEIVRNYLSPTLSNRKLQSITSTEIEALYLHLAERGKSNGKAGLSPRTIHHAHRVLAQIFKSALRKRLVRFNPMDAVENVPRCEEREVEVLDEAGIHALLCHLRGTMLYQPALLAISTGMRRGEILALRWSDIDFKRGFLTVQQTLEETSKGLRFKSPKTRAGRRQIVLPESTISALLAHRREQATKRISLGLGKDENNLVFTTFDGRPRLPRNFSREFKRAITRSTLKPITFHSLRHTHITQLLKSGVPVKVVSERAGHSNVTITLQTYAHVLPGMQEDAAAIFDQTLQRALQE